MLALGVSLQGFHLWAQESVPNLTIRLWWGLDITQEDLLQVSWQRSRWKEEGDKEACFHADALVQQHKGAEEIGPE